MPTTIRDKDTGQILVMMDDGRLVQAERPGWLAQAGRQMADIGSGAQMAAGHVLDKPEWIAQASQDTAARNRLFEGADEVYPWESMIGQAVPGMATAPLTAGGALGWLGLNAGLGAAETALDIGEGGTVGQRATAGAIGGVAGDVAGRIVGRVFNTATAMGDALAGLKLQGNPAAEAAEELGIQTMAYQRMKDSLGRDFAERMTQGAKASIFPPQIIRETVQANEALYNDAVADAVGVPWRDVGNLGVDWQNRVGQYFNDAYTAVDQTAFEAGDILLPDSVADRLRKIPTVKQANELDGLFTGIMAENGKRLSPGEYIEARDAMGDHINSLYNKGWEKAAIRAEKLRDTLDAAVEAKLPEGFREQFAQLREQYRVFNNVVEKPNVINKEGNVNIAALNRNLRSKNTGFGRTATAGGETTNQATRDLIEMAEAGDKPSLAAFKSSGTAENQAMREAQRDLSQAVEGPAGMLQATLNNAAPLAVPFMEAGGGLPYDALINQAAPAGIPQLGGAAGRSMLDEMFYPYVGMEDDRIKPGS